MLFNIDHKIEYEYDRPVFLEPHVLHLRPRCDGWQEVSNFRVAIEPDPSGLSESYDAEGNSTMFAWFDEITSRLSIDVEITASTKRLNAFDYLLRDSGIRVPISYEEWELELLAPYLKLSGTVDAEEIIEPLARQLAKEAGNETLAFLNRLNTWINGSFEKVIREEGPPNPSHVTLKELRGSCRDLACLFMDVSRVVGIASRFVSGYHTGDPDNDSKYLHAWAEVYIPGGGWRGYDPSLGLATCDSHLAVSHGAAAGNAAVVSGTFRGTGTSAKMSSSLTIG